MQLHNTRCFNSHMGVWVAKPDVIQSKHRLILDGQLLPTKHNAKSGNDRPKREIDRLGVATHEDVAIITIDDVMMKHASKYGGVSTTLVRRKIRAATAERSIKSIVLYIDSPGGHVDGQGDLLEDINRAKQKKPVFSYISNMGTSAAYWAAAITDYICCGRMSIIGSIGAYAVLYDTKEAYSMAGVEVIRVASGEKKGLGVDGTEITDEVKAEVQSEVDRIHEFFVTDVQSGRPKWDGSNQDGSILWGSESLEAGLVDEVNSWDNFLYRVTKGDVMPKEDEDVIIGNPSGESTSLAGATNKGVKAAEEDKKKDEPKDGEEGEGKDEKDKEIDRLKQENAELRGRLEELEKVNGLDSESAEEEDEDEKEKSEPKEEEEEDEEMKAVKMVKDAFAKRGMALSSDNLDDIAIQITAAKMDGPPKASGETKSPKKQAREVLAQYKKKYGFAKGGAKFKKENPELLEVLNS